MARRKLPPARDGQPSPVYDLDLLGQPYRFRPGRSELLCEWREDGPPGDPLARFTNLTWCFGGRSYKATARDIRSAASACTGHRPARFRCSC